jgi:hypothetical protein
MALFTAGARRTCAFADAVSELDEYKNLETSLEGKGYSAVFFLQEGTGKDRG